MKLLFHTLSALALASLVRSAPTSSGHNHTSSAFGQDFVPKNLLIFGDSYSDSCNSARLQQNDTQNVPFPTCYPVPEGRADMGPAWPESFRQLQGQKEVDGGPPGGSPVPGSTNQTTVVNMAFSSATCDNNLFPRLPIASVGDQIQLIQNGYNGTLASGFGSESVVNKVNADTDVALIWIGTNDLNFFTVNTTENHTRNMMDMETDPFRRGSILDYIGCIFGRFGQLYELGYRKFVLFEMIPLEFTLQYNPTQEVNQTTGVVPYGLATEIQQLTLSTNFIYPYKAMEFQAEFKDSKIEIFPMHELFERFYFNPSEYGFDNVNSTCNNCTITPDGNLWANDLHPGPRAGRIIAAKLMRFFKGDRGENLLAGED